MPLAEASSSSREQCIANDGLPSEKRRKEGKSGWKRQRWTIDSSSHEHNEHEHKHTRHALIALHCTRLAMPKTQELGEAAWKRWVCQIGYCWHR